MHVSIASFIPCVYWCLVYFCYECLFVTSAGMFKTELITWMYCWLVFCCHFFQFSTLAVACFFAFVTPAGVFLERVIHAFIRFQLFQPRFYMCVISARVFLERAIHAFFPFLLNRLFQPLFRLASCFQNEPYMRVIYVYYFSSRVGQVVWTDQARNFFN